MLNQNGLEYTPENIDGLLFRRHENKKLLRAGKHPKGAPKRTQECIMACVDIYQALTESRPCKRGMPHEKAIGILRDMAGKGWIDSRIVEETDRCFGQA